MVGIKFGMPAVLFRLLIGGRALGRDLKFWFGPQPKVSTSSLLLTLPFNILWLGASILLYCLSPDGWHQGAIDVPIDDGRHFCQGCCLEAICLPVGSPTSHAPQQDLVEILNHDH